MTTAHTATPWRVGRTRCVVADEPVPEVGGSDDVGYYGGHMICESVSAANAEFIVQAANEYHPMLAQLAIAGSRVRALEAQVATLVTALEGVIRVADRQTAEFDAARAAVNEVTSC